MDFDRVQGGDGDGGGDAGSPDKPAPNSVKTIEL